MAYRSTAKLRNINDRAKEVGLTEQLTPQDMEALRQFYAHTCLRCGKSPAISPDHVKPLSEGGANKVENLQLLCDNCNKAKGDKEIDYRGGKVLTPDLVSELSKSTDSPHKTNYKTDWLRIRDRYIAEEITLEELSSQEQVTLPAILQRSAREKWAQMKDNYRNKVSSDVISKLAEKEVDARMIAADTAQAVITSWLGSVKEEASANDALNAAKLLLLLNGDPTSRTATVDETELEDNDIIGAATSIARRAYRQAERRDTIRSAADESGAGAGWTD